MPDPIVFPISPNAGDDLIESHAFATDVMTAEDGTEQRVRLREHPVGRMDFGVLCWEREAALLSGLLQSHQADVWAVPQWPYALRLGENVTAGATTVPTNGYDYLFRDVVQWGEWALIWRDAFTWELVHVTGVALGDLTVDPLASGWSASDYVIPVRLGRMPNAAQIAWDERAVVSGRVGWTFDGAGPKVGGFGDLGPDDFVLDEVYMEASRPDAIREEYRRGFKVLGGKHGARDVYVPTLTPALGREFLWFVEAWYRAAYLVRDFLFRAGGRAHPFWYVSPERELVLVEDASGSEATVAFANYTAGQFPNTGARRYLRFRAPGGVFSDVAVIGATDNGNGTETLEFATPLDGTFPAATAGVSFRRLMRLDDDEVTLKWRGNNCAEAQIRMRELPNEAPIPED